MDELKVNDYVTECELIKSATEYCLSEKPHLDLKSLPKIRLFSRPQILSRTARKMKVYNVTCLVGK